MNTALNELDEKVMKLLHFFITEQGYNPIVLHGAKNEIWLENLDSDYEIVRIVTDYIHNDEQFDFDLFKTNQIMKKIKRKTLSVNLKTLSIFLNLGDNVDELSKDQYNFGNIDCVDIKEIDDLKSYKFLVNSFPNITDATNFKEQGTELLLKITRDINKKNEEDTKKAEELFKMKKPYITISLILINVIVFALMYILGNGSTDTKTLVDFGGLVPGFLNGKYGSYEFYRLVSSIFLHNGILHLLCNMYALYVLGPQLESFFGKVKFLIIYLLSGVAGNLLSLLFMADNVVSVGASGAIFGLMGALLYFGYHYRVYLGTVIKSQIIPILVINLIIGFLISGINNFAHIGGLVGGVLISMVVGIKHNTKISERVNGIIMSLLYFGFIIYMAFFR